MTQERIIDHLNRCIENNDIAIAHRQKQTEELIDQLTNIQNQIKELVQHNVEYKEAIQKLQQV